MGRGRNKAKQTRVARELKYNTPQTDFAALSRELQSQSGQVTPNGTVDKDTDEEELR